MNVFRKDNGDRPPLRTRLVTWLFPHRSIVLVVLDDAGNYTHVHVLARVNDFRNARTILQRARNAMGESLAHWREMVD